MHLDTKEMLQEHDDGDMNNFTRAFCLFSFAISYLL